MNFYPTNSLQKCAYGWMDRYAWSLPSHCREFKSYESCVVNVILKYNLYLVHWIAWPHDILDGLKYFYIQVFNIFSINYFHHKKIYYIIHTFLPTFGHNLKVSNCFHVLSNWLVHTGFVVCLWLTYISSFKKTRCNDSSVTAIKTKDKYTSCSHHTAIKVAVLRNSLHFSYLKWVL